MDSDYLKNSVGDALASALASAAAARPEDAVQYVGEYLLKHVDNENYKATLTEEELKKEKERDAAEAEAQAARSEADNKKQMKELSLEKIRLAETVEGAFEAAIACVKDNTAAKGAYIAVVEDEEEGEAPQEEKPAETEEGEEGEKKEDEKEKEIPLKPVSASATLRYVEADADNEFVIGSTLSRADGPVSFSAVDSDEAVFVSNVLANLPSIHFFRREKPGSYACYPIRNAKREAEAIMGIDTMGFDTAPFSEDDLAYFARVRDELASQISSISAKAEEASKELSSSIGEELQGAEVTDEDDVAAIEEKSKKKEGQLAAIRSIIEQKLDADKISEIKRSKAATKKVHQVIAAATFIVRMNKTNKVPKEIISDWSVLRQHIGDASDFISSVLAYDPAGKRYKRAFTLAKSAIKGLTADKANKASVAAGLLFQWVTTCIDVSDKAVAIRQKKKDAGEELPPESDDEGETEGANAEA
uniref:Uncharacterized protein n=1 Tax=Palpitomonas bilix TaxID=652834 RepID=A0A7S3D167_9EUKA|mmetsp:Transcript_18024/g.44755  ORF Transcript_18024/g.44755 Transcript_18024/m.44755 type:complete len:475 (+) Transcript_18024:284-1708(+)